VPYCNAYGAENKGGVGTPFGGFLNNPVAVQPICTTPATHRFRWVCECEHAGPIVHLCEQHYAEFDGKGEYRDVHGRTQPVPYNLKRDVRACPRCASIAASPESQHKCKVRLVTVS
jgi:hypothetical protein